MPNVGFIRKEVKEQAEKWSVIRSCVQGQAKIKAERTFHLPMPNDGSDNETALAKYESYIQRAVFFPATGRTSEGLVGQVFSKEITFDVPSQLEFLENDIDGSGMTLEQHSKTTLENVLNFGRGGLLVDAPTTENGIFITQSDIVNGRFRPRIIFYEPESIINWREITIGGETKLSLLVLKENKVIEDDGFEFECEPRWRVYQYDAESNSVNVSVWKTKSITNGQSKEEYEIETEPVTLLNTRGENVETIPFSFCGAVNNDASVDDAPLYPLACINIAHYRNSADYEQSLFLAGQQTPVFTGLTESWMDKYFKNKRITLGSSSAIGLPVGASAILLQAQPNSQPIEGMKHKEDLMKAIGAKLIEPTATRGTATEAEIEETSEASVLSTIAKNVSACYERAVLLCSLFIDTGESSLDDITVQLNSEFQVMGLNAQERQEVTAAWQNGLITRDEARDVYKRKGIATTANLEAFTLIDQELANATFNNNTQGE